MTKGDREKIEKIIFLCDNCKFATCEQCEINYGDIYAIKHLYEENQKLKEENKAVWHKNTEIEYDLEKTRNKMQREIKIKNEYLQLIIDLGFDYDGFEKSESLKELIDELIDLAKKAIHNDDTSVIYSGAEQGYNILHEKVGDDE